MISVPRRTRPAGYTIYLPWPAGCVGQGENLGKAIADYPSDAENQSHALVFGRHIIGIKSFLLVTVRLVRK